MTSSRILKGLTILSMASVLLVGCQSDKGSNPGTPEAPALPSAERLKFDFNFFKNNAPADRGNAVQAGRENFFNASVRVAFIGVVTDFILTPPITAFSLALNRAPILQPDGSYLWIYTWVEGAKEAQIRLRGKGNGDHVDWEMRISSNEESPAIVNEVWFEGQTRRDGDQGTWNFHDFTLPGKPVIARILWDATASGETLTFQDLAENPGDELTLSHTGTIDRINYYDASDKLNNTITWNEKDGTGSLRVPDYNDGKEACWDQRQMDATCPPVF